MAIARVKSRVQFQGRVKQNGKNKKYVPDWSTAKQKNSDTDDPTEAPKGRNCCFKRYHHQINPLTGSVYTFSVGSDHPGYDDDNNNPVDGDATSFPKEHVLTTDDQKSDGAFKSGFRTALILYRAPLVPENPDAAGSNKNEHDRESSCAFQSISAEPKNSCIASVSVSLDAPDNIEDEDDEPPNSVLMQAPLWEWPAEWFPADSFPVAPETTTEPCPEAKDATSDPPPATADATVHPSRSMGETMVNPCPAAEESTIVSPSAAVDSAAISSLGATETVSDLSSGSADTISDLSLEPADVTVEPTAATVTAIGLYPAAAVNTVNLTPVTTTSTAALTSVVVKSTPAPSLGPWHQCVISLFAGRRSNKSPQSAAEQPVSVISWTRERSNSKPEVTPPTLPPLELPKALAETRYKKNRVESHPDHAVDICRAPYHHFIGRAVMKGDVDNARAVQRGFRVNSYLTPLAQRRTNSDSSLLDRDGDVWAAWNELNITADAMPFTKSHSDTNLQHPQTGVRMARNTTMFGAEQTKGQTGHCFLEDAGHRYPFGGLGL
ncbi:hypothetical protein G6011_01613 [Alternaria panax]|uniref:Uncharacterized protein n=1 Tax=Alternaria panax TaxID=48097 RepID=A0AAD4NVQ6_9PLEO|nr:hypothetical protein G6011_01613 [Alternaria panax]